MRLITSIMICLLFAVSYAGNPPSEEDAKGVLINSDITVEKYEVTGKEFKKNLPYPLIEMRLDERRWRLPNIEDFLYDEGADFIYCIGTKAYFIAHEYAGDTNVIFSSIINWKRLPMKEKVYGVSNELHPAMQMTLFRYIFPNMKKIGVLYSRQFNSAWYDAAKERAKEVDIEIIGRSVSFHKDITAGLQAILPKIDALWLISDPMVVSNNKSLLEIMKMCEERKIPILSYHEAFEKYGAALIVSVDNPTIGRQAVEIAIGLVAGHEIKEKVQYPAGSRIILNLHKLKAYGFKYNEDALASVNKVIE